MLSIVGNLFNAHVIKTMLKRLKNFSFASDKKSVSDIVFVIFIYTFVIREPITYRILK